MGTVVSADPPMALCGVLRSSKEFGDPDAITGNIPGDPDTAAGICAAWPVSCCMVKYGHTTKINEWSLQTSVYTGVKLR